jgi:hypothetical protein
VFDDEAISDRRNKHKALEVNKAMLIQQAFPSSRVFFLIPLIYPTNRSLDASSGQEGELLAAQPEKDGNRK